MSEPFKYIREMYEFSDRVEATVVGNNELRIDIADRLGKRSWRRAIAELPASDARRLRDWLNERYPVTETGEG